MIDLEEEMRAAVSDFRKAAYEFAQSHHPEDHKSMMDAQVRIFALYRAAAAPQVAADEQAYTAEEAREQFMDQVRHLVGYWERESRAPTAKEKLEGLAFSIMNIFDGTSGLTAFDIVCAPHPDDKQYCIDEGSKYFAPGMVINDCHLHEILFHGRAAAQVQAQEPFAWYVETEGVWGQERFTQIDPGKTYARVTPLYTAPVQPVAVPDGWRAAIEGLMDFAPTNEGPLPGMTRGGNWLRKHDVIEALSNIAAPAAQGDAKDAERYQFLLSEVVRNYVEFEEVCYEDLDVFIAAIDAAIAAKAAS